MERITLKLNLKRDIDGRLLDQEGNADLESREAVRLEAAGDSLQTEKADDPSEVGKRCASCRLSSGRLTAILFIFTKHILGIERTYCVAL